MKRLPIIVGLALIAFLGARAAELSPHATTSSSVGVTQAEDALSSAYKNHVSDLQVRGAGEVVRILSDDTDGNRHQRFILKTASGQTLLVAHNIDLAGRVGGLEVGDRVEFYGEYEWNAKGGVIHWTHRDPTGRHQGGWLKHNGRTYE